MKLDKEEAMRMIGEGMSYREVADHFSCTQSHLIHCFGPEYGAYRKKRKDSAVEDKILDTYRRRIKDAIAVATSKEDFGKRIKDILSSQEAVLFALFEPKEAQDQAA